MRKLFLFLSLSITLSAFCQQVFVGLKGGGHVGSVFIDHTILNAVNVNGVKSGVNGGVFMKYLIKQPSAKLKAGLQLSVNYAEKGWTQIFLEEPTYHAKMNYLEIPLEAIGYFGEKNKYFITFGLFFEHLVSVDLDEFPTLDTDAEGNEIDNQVDFQDFFTYQADRDKKFGYGGRASLGVFRQFSFGMLHLEAFFNYSISNFIDSGDLLGAEPDISNLWHTGLTIGYLIPFGKKDD